MKLVVNFKTFHACDTLRVIRKFRYLSRFCIFQYLDQTLVSRDFPFIKWGVSPSANEEMIKSFVSALLLLLLSINSYHIDL